MRIRLSAAVLATILMASSHCRAELQLPAIFSDHAMLQADLPCRIWGLADPDAEVNVVAGPVTLKTKANHLGRWVVWLPAQRSGTNMDLKISTGSQERILHDVLFGEVWFASGQSNMERSLHWSQDRAKVAARAANAHFRFFIVAHAVADDLAFDAKGHWEIADSNNVDHFSATACSFAIQLGERKKVPVGIVDSSFGGTRLASWVSEPTLDADGSLKYVRDNWNKILGQLPALEATYQSALQKWMTSLSPEDQANAKRGASLPGRPTEPAGPGSKLQPAGLYNGMVAPLAGFTVRGILWYQGENDADIVNAYPYRFLFRAMIESWRKAWGDEDLPFLFVQLARYHNPAFPLVRESQAKGIALAGTAMVVSIDQGTSEDVHYPNKEVIGKRLERAAEQVAYGQRDTYIPLQPSRLTRGGNELHVWFSPSGVSPLIKAAPLPYFAPASTEDPNAPRVVDGRAILDRPPTSQEMQQAAQIAGADGIFAPATMRVEGDSVVLTSSAVSNPTQVCYAWSSNAPAVLLWSPQELPITPFRLALDPDLEPACPEAH